MEKDFQKIIETISALEKTFEPNEYIRGEHNSDEERELYDMIGGICNVLFITDEGRPNHETMNNFSEYAPEGWHIGPGETDSFGWLTAIIHTPHGRFVYG